MALREKVAISQEELSDALESARKNTEVSEIAILSTCNRTEIYTTQVPPLSLSNWFEDYHKISRGQLLECSYCYHDAHAAKHMMRVASGLDSMVVGEPQILGQVKNAYFTAQAQGTMGKVLTRLFESTFSVAKLVRSDTDIGRNPVSLAYVAVKLASKIYEDLSKVTVLFIGAGETIELCARHLADQRVTQFLIANRTHTRAQALANEIGAKVLSLGDIHDNLYRADIVIAATGSPVPILGKGSIETALKARKHKPVFMVDLGMPRNIEPEATRLEDIYLYAIDDLQAIIADNVKMRQVAAEQAEIIIEQHVVRFMSWLRGQSSVDTIKEFRSQAEYLRDKAVTQALMSLKKGVSPEEVIKRLGHLLTNQLIHDPTVALRQIAEEGLEENMPVAKFLLGMHKIENS